MMHACSLSYSGGWSTKIAWTQRQKLQWAKTMPLHSSLGDRMRLRPPKKEILKLGTVTTQIRNSMDKFNARKQNSWTERHWREYPSGNRKDKRMMKFPEVERQTRPRRTEATLEKTCERHQATDSRGLKLWRGWEYVLGPGVVAHACNPSTLGGQGG